MEKYHIIRKVDLNLVAKSLSAEAQPGDVAVRSYAMKIRIFLPRYFKLSFRGIWYFMFARSARSTSQPYRSIYDRC